MTWTDERIERLKAMWTEGSTASQIAEELGGVSRNAVIGKAHRLGLESRPSPVKPGEEKEKKAKAAPAPKARRSQAARRSPRPRRAAGRRRRRARSRRPAPAAEARGARNRRSSIARSARAASSARARATRRRRSRRPRRAGWSRPSRPPRSPTRPALLDLNDRICRWPMGHPGEPDFHFCGQPSNPGYPLLRRTIAGSPTRRSCRAATAARRRRCPLAGREFAKKTRPTRKKSPGLTRRGFLLGAAKALCLLWAESSH